MKRIALVSTALSFALLATGCVSSKKIPATEAPVSTTAEVTTEATTTEEPTEASALAEATSEKVSSSEVATGSHKVKVELINIFKSVEGQYEFTTVVPKITIDGKEATELNESISDYIRKNYKLEMNGEYADGMSTSIYWGVKDSTLSIIICASDTSTDYFTQDVLNYDLDTQKSLKAVEVTKRLGMTDEEFFSKTSDILKKLCKGNSGYDLEKSLALVNYDKITPFVLPDGTAGVLGCIVYSSETQFDGLEAKRCLNMKTMERENFK